MIGSPGSSIEVERTNGSFGCISSLWLAAYTTAFALVGDGVVTVALMLSREGAGTCDDIGGRGCCCAQVLRPKTSCSCGMSDEPDRQLFWPSSSSSSFFSLCSQYLRLMLSSSRNPAATVCSCNAITTTSALLCCSPLRPRPCFEQNCFDSESATTWFELIHTGSPSLSSLKILTDFCLLAFDQNLRCSAGKGPHAPFRSADRAR